MKRALWRTAWLLVVLFVLSGPVVAWADRIITEDAAGALLLENGLDTLITETDAGAAGTPMRTLFGVGI